MAFEGYLIYIGDDEVPFSNEYIFKETFHISPGKRQDVNSGLNNNYVLRRNVAAHTRTTIEWSAPPQIDNITMVKICNQFTSKYISELERKVKIKYYVPSSDSYKQGYFYLADPEYVIKSIDEIKKKVFYATIKFSLVEY